MPIATSCDCGRQLNLKDELAGKTVKCPQCGNPLKVPGGKATSTAVATPPPVSSRSSGANPRPGAPSKPPPPKEEPKAGPKLLMGNFKSLDDFDESGAVKKKKKTYDQEEMSVLDVGTTGGAMAQLAAEALKDTEDKPKYRCPGCGKGLKPDDVICMRCGTNAKTGRRIGETGFTLSRGRLIGVGIVLLICGAGAAWHFTRPPEKTREDFKQMRVQEDVDEKTSVEASFAAKLVADGTEHGELLLHASYLGMDALPHLEKIVRSGTSAQKKVAVRLLETLAYNGYRSKDAVDALASLQRDPDPNLRERAIEALFWSAVEPKTFAFYWRPTEDDPQKRTDVAKEYEMPFVDNREQLEAAGLKMRKDPKTKKLFGNFGVQPTPVNLIPEAADRLEEFWRGESDRRNKLSVLIQTVRAGRKDLMRELIKYLENEPNTELGFSPSAADKNRAWRCLSGVEGKQWRRHDHWKAWWDATGQKLYPPPKKK
ncbi:MAG: hypothetical protein HUU15_10265 [Candidatus Brocadiae bacterium]|nr:hypothetical protein [Candidatus Brocadiia bacterium]